MSLRALHRLGIRALVLRLGHRSSPRVLRFAVATATLAAAAGCAGPLSTLDPAGPAAASIAALWWIMFAGAVALTLLTLGLLAIAYLRPAWLARFEPRRFMVVLGVVMPLPILAALVWAAFATGEDLLPARAGEGETFVVEVTATRWAWTFAYPSLGGATSEVLHLPAGQPVDLVVTSTDVIHSFWIPRLGGKIDAIPGHANRIRLLADRPGEYHGVCAEYCGDGHAAMRFIARAHDPAAFPQAVGGMP